MVRLARFASAGESRRALAPASGDASGFADCASGGSGRRFSLLLPRAEMDARRPPDDDVPGLARSRLVSRDLLPARDLAAAQDRPAATAVRAHAAGRLGLARIPA